MKMMEDGFTLGHRSAYSHPVVGMRRPLHHCTWRWMVDLAYFKDSGDLKRGQFRATCRELADVWGMPLSTFHRFKRELVDFLMVEVVDGPTHRAPSLWTIVNYDLYQMERTTERTVERKRNANGTQESETCTTSEGGARNANGTQTERTMERTMERLKKENSLEVKLLEEPRAVEPPRVFVDDRGHSWPALPKAGGLRAITVPASFVAIWKLWRDAAASSGEDNLATRKAETYSLILSHMSAGRTNAGEVWSATSAYLQRQSKTGKLAVSLRPKTFYAIKNAPIFDYIDEGQSEGGGSAINPRPWNNPTSAFLDIKRAARALSLPIPTIDKFSATWEQIERVNPDILNEARRLAQ